MNLILCHPQDQEAIWLYTELVKIGMSIELISPEQLLLSDWTQDVSTDLENFNIVTKSGITLRPNNIDLLINRTQSAIPIAWQKSDSTEQQYVQAELNAMLMAWFLQVDQKSTVLNPTVGYSLSGAPWNSNEWMNAGFKVGFEAKNFGNLELQGIQSLLVNGEIITSLSDSNELLEKGKCLAEISKTPLLEITTDYSGKELLHATSFPSFTSYGSSIVQHINHYYG